MFHGKFKILLIRSRSYRGLGAIRRLPVLCRRQGQQNHFHPTALLSRGPGTE